MSVNWQALFNPDLAIEAIPLILEGLPYTIALSLIGFVLGTILGFLVQVHFFVKKCVIIF